LAIEKEYFAGEIEGLQMNSKLCPVEAEMVSKLYGMEAKEEIEVD
jgi:hypothetical protein